MWLQLRFLTAFPSGEVRIPRLQNGVPRKTASVFHAWVFINPIRISGTKYQNELHYLQSTQPHYARLNKQ